MVLTGAPFVWTKVGYVCVHSLDECFVDLRLIGTEFPIGADGYGPFLVKGVIAIVWVFVFAEPVGDGCSAGGGDVEEEYDAAGVGCWWAGVCCCGWKEFGGGGIVVVVVC